MKITRLVFALCGSLLAASSVSGLPNPQLPTPSNHSSRVDGGHDRSIVAKRDLVDLRILPLGASIVWGLKSSDLNGFRKPLRDQLRWEGYQVDMVGSKSSGNMKDNDVEATPGYVIDQIHTAAALSYGYKPNVVLINAGTNDCVGNKDIDNAASRLESMINDLWANIGDETCIIVSTILINDVASVNDCRGIVNPMYRSLVASLAAEGKRIYLTDFDGWITIDDITQPDGTHPTDDGYKKMAGAWWETISQADADGAISAPQDVNLDTVTTTCLKVAGTGVNAGAETQTGSGYDDGIYYHDSVEQGILLTITSQWDRNQWYFARLFNQERDDLLGWINETDGSITYALWRNDGDGVMTKIDDMTNFPNQCIPRGGRFIDLNADGLDDFVCISYPDGALYGVINNGDGGGTSGPTWTSIGLIKDADPSFPQSQVRLGDIDGDGRADFIGLDTDGTAHVWRNGGTDDVPNVWQAMGVRWTGGDMGDLAGVRFEDLNGDGRDDWMWTANAGTTYTWTNSRSCRLGHVGDGLNVAWRQGFYTGASSGPTHRADFDGDVNRDRIHFARIYGEPEAFSLLGRQDFVYMEHVADGDSHIFNMRVWQNTGSGSTKLKADGDKYGNMQGSATGRQDYVWAYSGGAMIIFRNGGNDYITDGQSYWTQPQQNLFDPVALIGKNLDRRDLHLTDFDGDGKDDIVWTDPDNDNHVSVFINKYDGTTWSWNYQANPAPGLSCPYTKGLGLHDIPIRWGDISGNGRDDYVCIAPDGTMSGYVHETDGSWTYNVQFFGPKGYDRANFQLGDVNGDGKVDIIWTEKFSGDGYVYYNDGPQDIAGSSYHWDVDSNLMPAYAYAGNAAGTCTYYNDLNGDGRADQHVIRESFNNIAETSYNLCTGDHVGDDEDPSIDPGLPMPATTAVATTTTTVYIDPNIWSSPLPIVTCNPPCIIVLPPYKVPETTITFPPVTTTVTESYSDISTETVIVITFDPVTTSLIPVYNFNITDPSITSTTFGVTPSLFPTTTITLPIPPDGSSSSTVVVTSSPAKTTTWPVVSNQPSTVSVTTGKPPGPTCTEQPCGTVCTHNCGVCGKGGCTTPCAGCATSTGLCIGSLCPTTVVVGGGGGGGGGGDGDDPTSTTSTSTASSTTLQIPCASDTCGDACPMYAPVLSGATWAIEATTVDCAIYSTVYTSAMPTETEGVLTEMAVVSPTAVVITSPDTTVVPVERRKRSLPFWDTMKKIDNGTLDSTALVPRVLPNPATDDDRALYVMDLALKIQAGGGWVSQDEAVTGQWYDFPAQSESAMSGVSGLYGCTAVVIASTKGMYMAHIFEDPVFISNNMPTTDAYFQANSFNALRDGTAGAQSLSALIGTDAAPGVLHQKNRPRAYVITPRATLIDQINGITTPMAYQDRAQWVADQLTALIPSQTTVLLGYTRVAAAIATMADGFLGRTIVEADPFQYQLMPGGTVTDNPDEENGRPVGRWRLWVEDQLVTYFDFYTYKAAAAKSKNRRADTDEYYNPCADSAPTTTATPVCVIAEDPDQGINTAYCECSGYSTTLPTIASATSPCAYTVFTTPAPTTTPAPATTPYTFTDPYGDVIACSTSSVFAIAGLEATACAGSSTTLVTGTPPPSPTADCRLAEDPDAGINTAFCTCDSDPGATLPTLTGTLPCDYTVTGTVTVTTTGTTATPTPNPFAGNWATVTDILTWQQCSAGLFTCVTFRPTFSDDKINDWCKEIFDDPCGTTGFLLSDVGVGYGSAQWARDTDLDCLTTGPQSVEQCYDRFKTFYESPDCTIGTNAMEGCISDLYNAHGTYIGHLGLSGPCICHNG